MNKTKCVIDNRVFLLGLDFLYRETIKKYERGELLRCARIVCKALDVPPANVPIEGYYDEHPLLTEYFLRMRALQDVGDNRIPELSGLSEFLRLQAVSSSMLFGHTSGSNTLLPRGNDPLTVALNKSMPDWSIQNLTESAHSIAIKTDDYSLVGLAARIKDPVVLCATRESVVLYVELAAWGVAAPQEYEYEWAVDEGLAASAQRFIDTFNSLFDEHLPDAQASLAKTYWDAFQENEVYGRCARIGIDDPVMPTRYYHWGIFRQANGRLAVQDFWSPRIWTTSQYRRQLARTKGDGSLGKELTDLVDIEPDQRRQIEPAFFPVEDIAQQAKKEKLIGGKKPWWRFW